MINPRDLMEAWRLMEGTAAAKPNDGAGDSIAEAQRESMKQAVDGICGVCNDPISDPARAVEVLKPRKAHAPCAEREAVEKVRRKG